MVDGGPDFFNNPMSSFGLWRRIFGRFRFGKIDELENRCPLSVSFFNYTTHICLDHGVL